MRPTNGRAAGCNAAGKSDTLPAIVPPLRDILRIEAARMPPSPTSLTRHLSAPASLEPRPPPTPEPAPESSVDNDGECDGTLTLADVLQAQEDFRAGRITEE